MVHQITPDQSRRIRKLIRRSCCNWDEGNCLRLDNGDKNSCLQMLYQSCIVCSYFLKAVLPGDTALYHEIHHNQ